MQACPHLNKIDEGTGRVLALWAVDTVAKYNECDAKHAALVEALK